MSVQRSEADAKIYKLFWGEHRPSVAFRLRGAELFLREKRVRPESRKTVGFNRRIALGELRDDDGYDVSAFDKQPRL